MGLCSSSGSAHDVEMRHLCLLRKAIPCTPGETECATTPRTNRRRGVGQAIQRRLDTDITRQHPKDASSDAFRVTPSWDARREGKAEELSSGSRSQFVPNVAERGDAEIPGHGPNNRSEDAQTGANHRDSFGCHFASLSGLVLTWSRG